MLNFRVAGLVLIILSVRPTAGHAQSLHWKSISGVSGSSMLRKGADNKLFVVSGVSSLFDNPYALARLAIRPDTSVHALATALSTGCGPLIASSAKRGRLCLRYSMRRAYGRLRHSRVAVKYVRRRD